MYLLEKSGQMNYYGFTKATSNMYSVQFAWNGNVKPMSGVCIGSSPELEFALFTLCYVTRPGSTCRVKMQGKGGEVIRRIQTHEWIGANTNGGTNSLASAFFKV
uniref:Uridylate-specific endoribonuclease n=1 Tax=Ciona savignyi TaxID=51511 RepID=H2ZB63_CIOSA